MRTAHTWRSACVPNPPLPFAHTVAAIIARDQLVGTIAYVSTTPLVTESVHHVLNSTQRRTFDQLLAIGGPRPTCPPGLPERLRETILAGTSQALSSWSDRQLYLTKSQMLTALRCEGQVLAYAAAPQGGSTMRAPTAVGIVSHRAIQIAHTSPGLPIRHYVTEAIAAACAEAQFGSYWSDAPEGVKSDLIMQMVSRVTNFLDSWPPLDDRWTPRFEEPLQARVGKLVLSARADLVLGRPRANRQQSMLYCDLKSSGLHDTHEAEGRFYALVATLRHGVPPFRSTVYSLASGDYTDPDVTTDTLMASAEQVVSAVNAIVAVMMEQRRPALAPGQHCSWCPVGATCVASTLGAARAPQVHPVAS